MIISLQVRFSSCERKRIRQLVKRVPPLKRKWDKCQAYLWTSVRNQKANLKAMGMTHEYTDFPDINVHEHTSLMKGLFLPIKAVVGLFR